MVATNLIVPPTTALLEGARDWSALIAASLTNVTNAVSVLPPIVLALATGFLAVRLIKHYIVSRKPQRRHYSHYE